jgi:GT2 family glycosyltransferase
MPSIAIVILNWNGKELLKRFLPDIIKFSPEAQIYVADNGSTDESLSLLKEMFPSVIVIENSENLGFAGGYNRALEKVEEEIYCLLNSDVAVTEGWLKPVLDLFALNSNAGIVQPKIKDLSKPDYFEYAGAAGGFLDFFGYPFCRGRVFQSLEKDTGQYDDLAEIFWATGACLFIRKSIFRELKGFDSDYFAHQEEIDLCWRANNLGYKVMYNGSSTVFHLGGSTLSNMNPKKTFLNFRNSLYSITKNLPALRAIFVIICRLILDGVAALMFIYQGKWKHAGAILKAHLSYYRNVAKIIRKRSKKFGKKKYHITTSIIWSYFVNRIDIFSKLAKD